MPNRMHVHGIQDALRGGIAFLAALALMAAFAAAGCSKGLVCPAGTVKYNGTCTAVDDLGPGDDIVLPEILPSDDGKSDADVETVDAADIDVAKDAAKDTVSTDAPGSDVYPGGVIGKTCQTSAQCKSSTITTASCLGWKLGYCTLKGCGTGGVTCPDGAVCMGIALEQPACAKSCTVDGDCRVKDGYACKLLPDPSGVLKQICHVVSTSGAPGDGCSTPDDCAGVAGCLSNFTGGYCAQLTCGADEPCPDGTRCVLLSGQPRCLKSCTGPTDVAGCKVAGDLPRSCILLRDPASGDKVNVCGSVAANGIVGSQCLNETECASGRCDVAATGTCSQSTLPCILDNDCGPADACLQDSKKTFGFCTASCSSSTTCPALSLCVETVAAGTTKRVGRCMPGCTTAADCRAEAGMACMYGDPGDTGRYACVALGLGEIGTPCAEDPDCRVGTCLLGTGSTAGYCSAQCATLDSSLCPFPTDCQAVGGVNRCLLRCRSNGDCIGDTQCNQLLDKPVCVPKS